MRPTGAPKQIQYRAKKSKPHPEAAVSRTDRLRKTTDEMLRSFAELQVVLEREGADVKPSLRNLLDQQMQSLHALQADMATGDPSRRAWAFGQAAAPVLEIIAQRVHKEQVESSAEVVTRCKRSVQAFRTALTASAEGRDL